jgi:hypothetical protein
MPSISVEVMVVLGANPADAILSRSGEESLGHRAAWRAPSPYHSQRIAGGPSLADVIYVQ